MTTGRGRIRGSEANVQYLPRTEWQCVECSHVNEKATGACADCGESYETTRKADRETHGEES